MKKKISLSILMAVVMFAGCEKELQDEFVQDAENLPKTSSLNKEITNSFPYVLEKINIDQEDISLFLYHQGEKSVHEFQLVWDGIIYHDQDYGKKVFLALADLSSDTDSSLKSSQILQGKLNIPGITQSNSNLLVEIVNLSDTTLEVKIELNNGEGSWQGSNYMDSTAYTPTDLTFHIYDSTYIESLYDSIGYPGIPLDSVYNPIDSVFNPIDSVFNPIDSAYNPIDSVYIPETPIDSVSVSS